MRRDRLRVPDRVARHQRATGHDAVGEQCVVALREGVAAVASQREEGEAVVAPLEHDPARPAVVVLALRLRLPPGPQPQVHEPDRRHHRQRQHRHVQDPDLVHAVAPTAPAARPPPATPAGHSPAINSRNEAGSPGASNQRRDRISSTSSATFASDSSRSRPLATCSTALADDHHDGQQPGSVLAARQRARHEQHGHPGRQRQAACGHLCVGRQHGLHDADALGQLRREGGDDVHHAQPQRQRRQPGRRPGQAIDACPHANRIGAGGAGAVSHQHDLRPASLRA